VGQLDVLIMAGYYSENGASGDHVSTYLVGVLDNLEDYQERKAQGDKR